MSTLRCKLFGHKDSEFSDGMGGFRSDWTPPLHLHCTRWGCGEPLYENCHCGICRIEGTGKYAPKKEATHEK